MPVKNALHIAAKAGNLAEVQSQVRNFDINAKGGKYDSTALCMAAANGHTEAVKLLLTLNADVNIPDVSTPMISVHVMYFPYPIYYLCCVTRSRYTTSLQLSVNIQCYSLSSFYPIPPTNVIFVTVLLCFSFC